MLALAAEELDRLDAGRREPLVRIGGDLRPDRAGGAPRRRLLRDLGYHAGLLSLAGAADADDDGTAGPLPGRGRGASRSSASTSSRPSAGRSCRIGFWRRFAEIENVVAIKIAPFNRYQTLDVVRAVAESGRDDIALYTGNDDNIVLDLLTPYRFRVGGREVERRIVGGLLGHWAVWTRRAVELLDECHAAAEPAERLPPDLLRLAVEVTDANAAIFDAANGFAGCIAGHSRGPPPPGPARRHLVPRPARDASAPARREEIDRVYRAYPHLNDDDFVAAHRDEWLRP